MGKKFHKSHHFDVHAKTPMLTEAVRSGVGGKKLIEVKSAPSLYPPQHGSVIPSWYVTLSNSN
jgi:hypothetical protein